MDPSNHGGCTGTFSGVGVAGLPGCAAVGGNVMWKFLNASINLAMSASTYGDAGTVAVLGVNGVAPGYYVASAPAGYVAATVVHPACSGSSQSNSISSYWMVCKNGFNTTWWWRGGATADLPLSIVGSEANRAKFGAASGSITAFFEALAWGDIAPRAIFIAEARASFYPYSTVSPSDLAVIDSYAADLGLYVAAGGGLLSNTQRADTTGGDFGDHYGYLEVLAPRLALNPTTTYTKANTCWPSLTAFGQESFPALSRAELQGCWHQYFVGDPGAMRFLAAEPATNGVDLFYTSVGGVSVDFVLGPTPQFISCGAMRPFYQMTERPLVRERAPERAFGERSEPRSEHMASAASPRASVLVAARSNHWLHFYVSNVFEGYARGNRWICSDFLTLSLSHTHTHPLIRLQFPCVATSGLPIVYTELGSAYCTTDQYSLIPVAPVATALCRFKLDQPGNSIYSAAGSVTLSFYITAPTATVSSTATRSFSVTNSRR
jgi:hypothetical protein